VRFERDETSEISSRPSPIPSSAARGGTPEPATYEVGGPSPLPAAKETPEPRTVRGADGPLAVFVTHGMGQQIPFETLDLVAEGLRRVDALRREAAADLPAPIARSVAIEGQRMQRLELKLHRPDGTEREVHVYEGYWAPLTEGQVKLRDVVSFFFRGGWNGIWNAARKGGFRRWLFGRYPLLDVPASTVLTLAIALAVVLGLAALNAAVALVAIARSPLKDPPRWLDDALFADLTTGMNLWVTLVFLFALTLISAKGWRRGPALLRKCAGAASIFAFALVSGGTALAGLSLPVLFWAHIRCAPGDAGRGILPHALGAGFVDGFDRAFQAGALALLGTVAAVLVLAGAGKLLAGASREIHAGGSRAVVYVLGLAGAVIFLASLAGEIRAALALCTKVASVPILLRGISWPLLFAISAWVRSLLVQYPGDVAAYVTPQVLDRFHDLRDEIKQAVWTRARAVYAAASADGTGFLYERCAMVGHSLGSVIAYDTLNRLIQEDESAPGVPATPLPRLNVVARTPLFLTFGSPLDKTAFIFGIAGKKTTEAREALAASVQPMICDYGFRPRRWVNIYSPWDLVSGSLDFYDPPGSVDSRRVENVRDPLATTLLAAHLEYWKNPLLFEILHAELTA
jgi:hypothetical protein